MNTPGFSASRQSAHRGVLAGLALMLLPVLVWAAAEPAEHRAKIITSHEKRAECISSVQVNAIDGELVHVQPLGFYLDPGKHTLTARTVVYNSFCKAVGGTNNADSSVPLEADFEAGKTYFVGFDHSADHRSDWKLVIWKVE